MGIVPTIGVEALAFVGDPGGVGVMTDGRWDCIDNSSDLLILSEIDFLRCLRQHCPLVDPANWLAWTSLSILAIALLRLNIECSSEQLLLIDYTIEFLPLKVLVDSLRSATLNPYTSPVTVSKLLGLSCCREDKEGLILAKQIISYFNSLGIFFRFCTCRYQFNVVTALVWV